MSSDRGEPRQTKRGTRFDWQLDGRPKTGTGRNVPDGRRVRDRNDGHSITVENKVVEGKPVPGKTVDIPDRRKGDRRQ